MDREIKFRAWHKTANYMCKNTTTDYLTKDYLEFMQYIGLKDKSGIDIFEGDIVKYYNYSCKEFDYCKIIWKGEFISHVAEDCLGNMNFIQKIDERRLEVVGNIYENLNLLNEEENDYDKL